MSKFWNWCRTYLWIPLLFAVGILTWLLLRRKSPLAQTRAELQAIRAGARVDEMKVRMGIEAAKKHVEVVYKNELDALDKRQRAKAEEMRYAPAKLARFLIRVGARRF